MSELLDPITSLPTPFNMIVLIVLIGAISGIITTIVKQFGAFAQQRQDLAFKRELIIAACRPTRCSGWLRAAPSRLRRNRRLFTPINILLARPDSRGLR